MEWNNPCQMSFSDIPINPVHYEDLYIRIASVYLRLRGSIFKKSSSDLTIW